jgi:hypothetical protein
VIPLANSIRSFWIPETSNDPAFRRLIRQDKIATAVFLGGLLSAGLGIVACAIGMAVTLT